MGFYLRSELKPRPWPVELYSIVRDWYNVPGLEPAACRRIVEDAIRRGMPDEYVDVDQIAAGGVVGTRLLLDGSRLDDPWVWAVMTPDGLRATEVPVDILPTLFELSRIAANATSRDQVMSEAAAYFDDPDDLKLISSALIDSVVHGVWPTIDRPGIYRREHASLVLRTRTGRTLVTDPKRCSLDWTTRQGAFPAERSWAPASVVITHSHDDHFHLPSIASYVTADDPVIVPHVPEHTLLSLDMAAMLARVDQPASTPQWWSRLRVGDIAVGVLPFYGEQPTRTWPTGNSMRNWGNCYRFDFDGLAVAVLADSGVDPDGNMVEVLRRSAEEHGPIDVLMSCCHRFPEMLNVGLPHYAFTIPFDVLREHRANLGSITSGPTGLAAACHAAGARYFLPYAHGFSRLFECPSGEEDVYTEDDAVSWLRQELATTGSKTQILEWRPGDLLTWEGSSVRVERHP